VDIYQDVTSRIVAAIEANPGKFQMPWQRGGGGLPTNAHTHNGYQGVNIITLWVCGMAFGSQTWATYRQWQEMGAQVRKGEKGSPIIYYSTFEREQDDGTQKAVPFIKSSSVFNADQVDGYTTPQKAEMPPLERLEAVDSFAKATGAIIREGGAQACYVPALDIIKMPDGERFIDTATSSRTESFYSTLCHELVHFTGHPSRLSRDMKGRFGDPRYAEEELIAELGAAFLCARLGISAEPREDHAAYINNWLTALKNEKRFIFAAASQAQLAADYLVQLAQPRT